MTMTDKGTGSMTKDEFIDGYVPLPTKKFDEGEYHPFIKGLLQELPEPQVLKAEWSVEERAVWLQTAASIFSMLYAGLGTVKVTIEHGGSH